MKWANHSRGPAAGKGQNHKPGILHDLHTGWYKLQTGGSRRGRECTRERDREGNGNGIGIGLTARIRARNLPLSVALLGLDKRVRSTIMNTFTTGLCDDSPGQ
jgi:hypothetical protein